MSLFCQLKQFGVKLQRMLTNQFYAGFVANAAFFHYTRNKSVELGTKIICPDPKRYTGEHPQYDEHTKVFADTMAGAIF